MAYLESGGPVGELFAGGKNDQPEIFMNKRTDDYLEMTDAGVKNRRVQKAVQRKGGVSPHWEGGCRLLRKSGSF